MKKIIYIVFLLGFWSCQTSTQKVPVEKKPIEELTKFEFNEEIHNFGEINSGEIVIFNFVIANTGDNNLEIKNVESDCACIEINVNSRTIAPREKGIIEVEFDSSGTFGRQYKPIVVEMNVKEKIINLAIIAEVSNEQIEINN